MAALADWLANLAAPWVNFYADSGAAETLVMFLHLGGMLAAGGIAFSLDRTVLRTGTVGGRGESAELVWEIHNAHRVVIAGLAVVILSGVALTVADPTVFLVSWIYWAKLGGVALLLVNGLFLKRAGRRLLTDPSDEGAWKLLRVSAVRSAALWAFTVLTGVAITVYA